MVERFINRLIFRIYNHSKKYLLDHNCLVEKSKFDYTFWGGL